MAEDDEVTSFNETRLDANGKKLRDDMLVTGAVSGLHELVVKSGDFPAAARLTNHVHVHMSQLSHNAGNWSLAVQEIGAAVIKVRAALLSAVLDGAQKAKAVDEIIEGLPAKVEQALARAKPNEPTGGPELPSVTPLAEIPKPNTNGGPVVPARSGAAAAGGGMY